MNTNKYTYGICCGALAASCTPLTLFFASSGSILTAGYTTFNVSLAFLLGFCIGVNEDLSPPPIDEERIKVNLAWHDKKTEKLRILNINRRTT